MNQQDKDAAHDAMWRAGKYARSAENQRMFTAELERLQKENEKKIIKRSGMLNGFIYCFIIMSIFEVVVSVVRSI